MVNVYILLKTFLFFFYTIWSIRTTPQIVYKFTTVNSPFLKKSIGTGIPTKCWYSYPALYTNLNLKLVIMLWKTNDFLKFNLYNLYRNPRKSTILLRNVKLEMSFVFKCKTKNNWLKHNIFFLQKYYVQITLNDVW